MAGIATVILGGLELFTHLAPLVVDTVVKVEGIFGGGHGPEKKSAVSAAVTDVLNIFNSVTGRNSASSDLTNAIDNLVEAAVAFAQAEGLLLPHTPKTPAPAQGQAAA